MWKKEDVSAESPAMAQPAAPPRPVERPGTIATIGPSISIKGDISGEEDLVIEGSVEGAIQLGSNNITIGNNGRVTANIRGKRICVDGQVKGDLFGEEVLIRKTGRVEGNAKAPRVTLENGCNFRGSIDMKPSEDPPVGKPKMRPASRARATV